MTQAEIEPSVRRTLEQGLEILALETNETRLDRLTRLVLLLQEWAGQINLTGHRDPDTIARRLVLDACALAAAVPEIRRSRALADLGSGAGFPGLPIAILHPELTVRLVDSRRRRHHFQRAARRSLGLDHVEPILGRAEEVDVEASGVVVAQAMTQPDEALALMARWVEPGGIAVLPASESAAPPESSPPFVEVERRTYDVPLTETPRQLWIVRRAEDR